MHPFGEAKNSIKFSNNQIVLDEQQLSEIFLHPDVKDREVVLFVIVGSYRRGKSFFMDYCLRFMYANYKSVNNPANTFANKSTWIGSPDEPLDGFPWRSGSFRDTTGISFWSDVFLYDPPNTDPLAIILVDTQGLFDPETSTEENMKILSISTLFSSTLILNINNVIQEDQLEYLQFTTEYANFVHKPQLADLKPFQKFMFLIRDWQNVDDYDFGFDGGRKYLDHILKVDQSNLGSANLQNVRRHIRESFDQLQCCLLPHPGKKVATSSSYDGRWSSMDGDFLAEMKNLIENLFKQENLAIKKVDGINVKACELFELMKGFVMVFSAPGLIPKPKSLYELTVGKFLTETVSNCYEIYEKELKSPQNRDEIDLIHSHAQSMALNIYSDAKKMGNDEHAVKYRKILEEKIQKRENEWKNSMKSHFDQIEMEQQKAAEAAREIERIRQADEEKKLKAKQEELQRQIDEQERENAKRKEELRLQQEKIEEELRKQRVAEEEIRKEKERQDELRRRIEEEERRRREEEEERNRIKVQIDELGINFHVPKPKCSVM